MQYSLDVEFSDGDIFHGIAEGEGDPSEQAIAILREDHSVVSIAARDENGKLIRFFDFRDTPNTEETGR